MTTPINYVSSIATKYGDVENVKADSKTLNDIIRRQGTSLLIDAIAEHVGQSVLKFKLSEIESQRLLNSLLAELKEAILERV